MIMGKIPIRKKIIIKVDINKKWKFILYGYKMNHKQKEIIWEDVYKDLKRFKYCINMQ